MGWGGGGGSGGGSSSWGSSWSWSSSWSSSTSGGGTPGQAPEGLPAAAGNYIQVNTGSAEMSDTDREKAVADQMAKLGATKVGSDPAEYELNGDHITFDDRYAYGHLLSDGHVQIDGYSQTRADLQTHLGGDTREVYGNTVPGSAIVYAGAANKGLSGDAFSATLADGTTQGAMTSDTQWTAFVVDHEIAHADGYANENQANQVAYTDVATRGY